MPSHITQGSDPEFSIANSSGECVPADTLFEDQNGQLGCDGRSDTGELRPSPGSTTRHLMNLRGLIREFSDDHPDYQMLGGSRHFRQPLGGHIHFSGNPVRQPVKIVKALDAHLAIPLLMLESRISARERRQNHDYGHLGQYRSERDRYGGFEYRTLSSWLISMNVAKMTLEIAMLIAYDYEHLLDGDGKAFIDTQDYSIQQKYNNAEKDERFVYQGRQTTLFRLAKQAVRKLKTLPNACNVMNSILTLENALRLRARWHQELDFTKRWHLPETSLSLKEVDWKEKVFTIEDLPIFTSISNLDCLELVNIVRQDIGEVLLENTYYIYGIRNSYGKDFSVSCSFDHYLARVDSYSIAGRWFGNARDVAPTPDAVLIGVSKILREDARRPESARAISRIIQTIERL